MWKALRSLNGFSEVLGLTFALHISISGFKFDTIIVEYIMSIHANSLSVVIDTNIFVGACLGMGAPNRVIVAALQNQFAPIMGVALFSEYEAVLSREALFRESRLNASERSELLDIFLAKCRWTRVYYGWRPNLRDEADNHLVELAIAAGASKIVTRNLRDFSNAQLRFDGLQAVSPQDFLKELNP
jgi:putative PIN family toxin of toxin-antitoxin system